METPETTTGKEVKSQTEARQGAEHLLKKLANDLRVYRADYQRKILNRYLSEVLPPIEAEQRKEDEHQQALDDLLALTENKSADEIRAMTASMS